MSGKDYYDAGNPEWQDTTWDELSFDPTPLGTWGDLLSFGETRYFDISIAALTTETFDAEFTLTGQIWDALGSYASQSQMFIFVDGIENKTSGGSNPNPNPNPIPEPSSIALFALAALGLFGRKIKA